MDIESVFMVICVYECVCVRCVWCVDCVCGLWMRSNGGQEVITNEDDLLYKKERRLECN